MTVKRLMSLGFALVFVLAACQDDGGSANLGDDMTTVTETPMAEGIASITLPDDFSDSDFPVKVVTVDAHGKMIGERIIRTWDESLEDDAFDLAQDRLEFKRHEVLKGGRDEELRAFFRKVANDPNADEEDREYARGMLR